MRNLSRAKRAALRALVADVKAGRSRVLRMPAGLAKPRLSGTLSVRFDRVALAA